MKFILAAMLLSISTLAFAQGEIRYSPVPATRPSVAMQNTTCFAKVPAIAKKLGVHPGAAGTLAIEGCDGKQYDLLALINGLIDRMDRASKK